MHVSLTRFLWLHCMCNGILYYTHMHCAVWKSHLFVQRSTTCAIPFYYLVLTYSIGRLRVWFVKNQVMSTFWTTFRVLPTARAYREATQQRAFAKVNVKHLYRISSSCRYRSLPLAWRSCPTWRCSCAVCSRVTSRCHWVSPALSWWSPVSIK